MSSVTVVVCGFGTNEFGFRLEREWGCRLNRCGRQEVSCEPRQVKRSVSDGIQLRPHRRFDRKDEGKIRRGLVRDTSSVSINILHLVQYGKQRNFMK